MDAKICCIPTMPSRKKYLLPALKSLAPQVDVLYVCLNNHKEVPEELKTIPKVHAFMPDRDYGSIGRFTKIPSTPPYYYFTCDDDIIYPTSYIDYLQQSIDRYGRGAVVALHGTMYPSNPKGFRDRTDVYHCLRDLLSDKETHVGGTGVMGWHSDTIKISMEMFKHNNYDDIEFSAICNRAKVPIVVLKHSRAYLTYQNVPDEETIAHETNLHPERLDVMAKEVNWRLWGV